MAQSVAKSFCKIRVRVLCGCNQFLNAFKSDGETPVARTEFWKAALNRCDGILKSAGLRGILKEQVYQSLDIPFLFVMHSPIRVRDKR